MAEISRGRNQFRGQDLVREGAQKYVKLLVAHKMMRNNTHSRDWTTAAVVAKYKYVWRGNRTRSLLDFVQL